MKNLANCTPTEFVTQTVRIKKIAQDWMTATDILNILRTVPNYKTLGENPSAEERAQVLKDNLKIRQDQGMENFSKLFDAAFEKNPEKTLEMLALSCFVEPSEVDSHPMTWYMQSVNEILNDETVRNFFSSLAQLGQKNTLKR